MLGTAYADILDPLVLSSVQLGISPDGLFGSNRPTVDAVIAAIPSRRVEMQLRELRQSNPQNQLEGHDFNEVAALSVAVPYRDSVVTERSCTGLINTNKINRSFRTEMTSDLGNLSAPLSQPAAS
jgi:hypothetical protein